MAWLIFKQLPHTFFWRNYYINFNLLAAPLPNRFFFNFVHILLTINSRNTVWGQSCFEEKDNLITPWCIQACRVRKPFYSLHTYFPYVLLPAAEIYTSIALPSFLYSLFPVVRLIRNRNIGTATRVDARVQKPNYQLTACSGLVPTVCNVWIYRQFSLSDFSCLSQSELSWRTHEYRR